MTESMAQTQEELLLKKSDIWKVFDQISPTYDLLNHLLSFGLDIHWRGQLAKFLPNGENLRLLDLATGTADVPILLCARNPQIREVYGVDLADKMLEIGQKKIVRKKLADKILLKRADAHQLPFEANTFDCATMAFGIRNMQDPLLVLKQTYRVLKTPGRAIILEFSLPANKIWQTFYLFYLRKLVPVLGGLLSGNFAAYRYLNQTVETFPSGREFCSLLKQAGFQETTAHSLMGGVASVYVGEK